MYPLKQTPAALRLVGVNPIWCYNGMQGTPNPGGNSPWEEGKQKGEGRVMKRKLFIVMVATVALLALVAVGTALGQEPEDVELPLQEPIETPGESAGGVGAMAVQQPPYTLNYQGYLTDGSGNPLNGTYKLTFRLYRDPVTTTVRWGPEDHIDVPVTNGLFHVVLGDLSQPGGKALSSVYFSYALYLEVAVDGTALTPRQPLRPSAYAFGIVPGTQVVGNPEGIYYGLAVHNQGQFPGDSEYPRGDSGILARGYMHGLVALATSDLSDEAIYSYSFVNAQGYKSREPSYIWAPGYAAVSATDATSVTITPTYSGTAHLSTSGTGTRLVYIPMTIPSQLLGQEVTVEELAVYYRTTNSSTYIDETHLYRMTSPGQTEALITNFNDQISMTPISYTLPSTGNYTLTAEAGPVSIQLALHFDNPAHEIYLYAVRLRLGHVD